ncbi:MAG: hypothetical protein ACRYGK_03370 [Janthinobacterium lividum]
MPSSIKSQIHQPVQRAEPGQNDPALASGESRVSHASVGRTSHKTILNQRDRFLVRSFPEGISDLKMRNSVEAKKFANKTPWDHCFTLGEKEGKFGVALEPGLNQLAKLDFSSHLNLAGHSEDDHFANHSASHLARKLAKCGLRQVGIIKFQSCRIGAGTFLADFAAALRMRGIEFGYVAAYDGVYRDFRLLHYRKNQPPKLDYVRSQYRKVGHSSDTAAHTVVVKGNIDLRFPDTKYNHGFKTSKLTHVKIESIAKAEPIGAAKSISGVRWVEALYQEFDLDLQKILVAVTNDNRCPNSARDGLKTFLENSKRMRHFFGLPEFAEAKAKGSKPVSSSPDIFKMAAAPLLLAMAPTANANADEAFALSSLSQLKNLLSLRSQVQDEFAQSASQALICLARHMERFPKDSAKEAVHIITTFTDGLPEKEWNAVRLACANLPEADSAYVRQVRQFGLSALITPEVASQLDATPFKDLSQTTSLIIAEANNRGIGVEIRDAKHGKYVLSYGGVKHSCQSSMPSAIGKSARLSCNEKIESVKRLSDAGVKTLDQIVISSQSHQEAFLKRHGQIMVKPAYGWSGIGMTKVTDKAHLAAAISHAKKQKSLIEKRQGAGTGDKIILQQFLPGNDLRLVVIDFQVTAAAMRGPVHLVGDGRKTVKQLIQDWNRAREAQEASTITLGSEIDQCLGAAKLTLSSVPHRDQYFMASKFDNVEDVTGVVHEDILKAAEKAATCFQIPVVGFDFLVENPVQSDYYFLGAHERPRFDIHGDSPTVDNFLDCLFPYSR